MENQRKEYVAVDIMKLLCSFFVIGVHWSPFRDFGYLANYWNDSVVCRITVPFFFIAAGFFLRDKISKKDAVHGYVVRVFRLYVVYTFIYLPMILSEAVQKEGTKIQRLIALLRDFLWGGVYLQFWYFPALIFAVLMIYILKEKCKVSDYVLGVLAVILYTIGVLGSPNYLEANIPVISGFLKKVGLAYNTRNGIFYGFPLVLLGYFIYKYESALRKLKIRMVLPILFFLWLSEAYIANRCWNCTYASMWFLTPVVAAGVFIALIRIRCPRFLDANIGRVCRSLSVWIFGMHMYVYHEFSFLVGNWQVGYLYRCIALALFTALWGGLVIFMSNFQAFNWFKNLY